MTKIERKKEKKKRNKEIKKEKKRRQICKNNNLHLEKRQVSFVGLKKYST